MRRWLTLTRTRVLKASGWLFVVFAFLFAAGAAFSPFWIPKPVTEQLGNLVPAALMLTLGTLLLTKSRESEDVEEKRSLFFLESCVKGYDEAKTLLADGNNDRATWIGAARALKLAQILAEKVSLDAHRHVLELHRLKYRGFFQLLLTEKTATFFYGTNDVSAPIDEAAAASSAPRERRGRTNTSTVNRLDEKSLHAVWEAAKWPTDYQDPLDADFSEEEQGALLVLFPGLYEYLGHLKRYHTASGKLLPRDNNENG